MSRLFLIRHGETAGNASRIVQRLTSRSHHATARCRRSGWRAGLAGAGIVSSYFARAASTAEYLQRATAAPLSFEPLLQERNFGDLRGTP